MAANDSKPLPTLTPRQIRNFHRGVIPRGPDECWPWNKSTFATGYGQVYIGNGKFLAHRVAFFISTGTDPVGLYICHRCDNPICCNPAHLFLGTPQDNIDDCRSKGRMHKASGERHKSKTNPEHILKGELAGASKLTTETVLSIRHDYLSGNFSHQQLASKFGVRRGTIGKILNGETWKHLPLRSDESVAIAKSHITRYGEANTSAKLSIENIKAIRDAHATGKFTYVQLSKTYCVTPENISSIVKRRIWKEVA